MNDQARAELERLKQRQARLAQELAQLSTQLNLLEQRLSQPQPEAAGQAAGARSQQTGVRSPEVLKRESPPAVQRSATQPVSIPSVRLPPVIPPAPVIARNSVPPAATSPMVAAVPEKVQMGEQRHPAVPKPPPPRLRAEAAGLDFSKGVCQSCGGHLEFPSSAAGDSILCPHCGQSTLLTATPIPMAPPLPKSAALTAEPVGGGWTAVPSPQPAKPALAGRGSFEMRLGTYWLVPQQA